MKIKYKAPLTILAFTLFLSAASGYISYHDNVELIERAVQNELQTVTNVIQNGINDQASKAASTASIFVNEPAVQAALRARDRDKLIKITVPAFNVQKEKFGASTGHFHVPPAISFLRVHKVNLYGDDLSSTRELVLAAQTEKRPLQGIEISTTGVSIKGIDVVKDDKGFIGTFEIGQSFSSVLEDVKKNTGFEAGAFVDDALMNRIATEAPKVDLERIIGGYRNVFATDWAKIRNVVTPDLITRVNDITYEVKEIHGQFLGLVIIPMLDFKGTQIGSIWAVGNFDSYQNELRTSLITCISFALLQALVLAGVVLVVFNALLLLPIVDIDEKLHELSEGQVNKDEKIDLEIAHLTHRQDEVGSLARSLEKFNKYIADQRTSTQNPKEK